MAALTSPRVRPEFSLIETEAFRELVSARQALRGAKRRLQTEALSPVDRGSFTAAHDRAAKRVTAAAFALNQAIDASEDA